MEKFSRIRYEAPEVRVIETRFEGMICQSQNTMDGRNSYDTTDTNPFA